MEQVDKVFKLRLTVYCFNKWEEALVTTAGLGIKSVCRVVDCVVTLDSRPDVERIEKIKRVVQDGFEMQGYYVERVEVGNVS